MATLHGSGTLVSRRSVVWGTGYTIDTRRAVSRVQTFDQPTDEALTSQLSIGMPGMVFGNGRPTGVGVFQGSLLLPRAVMPTYPTGPLVQASRTGPPTVGPLSVDFQVSASGGTAPYTYRWDFGDGATSTQQNPTHVYAQPGSMSVTVTVTDDVGAKTTQQLYVYAGIAFSVSAQAVPSSGVAPADTAFVALPADGVPPYSYLWDFGDGATSSQQNPTHTYTVSGSYQATVVVTDADGHKTAAAVAISVSEPLSAQVARVPDIGPVGMITTFQARVTGGKPPYQYQWTLGDGLTSKAPTTVRQFNVVGIHNIKLTITDAEGTSYDTYSSVFTGPLSDIEPAVLAAMPIATPNTGDVGTVTSFQARITGGRAPYAVLWEFPDGTKTRELYPVRTFDVAGLHNVKLTVTDADYRICEAHSSVLTGPLSDIEPAVLTALPTVTPNTGPVGVVTSFQARIVGGHAPYRALWEFPDGTRTRELNPVRIFDIAGLHNVKLTVTDADDHTCEAYCAITVGGSDVIVTPPEPPQPVVPGPALLVSSSTPPDVGPLSVAFQVTPTGGVGPYTYRWDFGDGMTSTQQNPTHVFAQPGSMNVTVTVTGSNGGETTQHVYVQAGIAFSVSAQCTPADGSPQLTVDFTAQATDGVAPYTYAWDFGDGATSTEQNPSYMYGEAGNYQAAVVVTDAVGHKTSAAVAVRVIAPLFADPVRIPDIGPVGLVTSFQSRITGGRPPYRMTWDFADGFSSRRRNPVHQFVREGFYNVGLFVTDADGRTFTTYRAVDVGPVQQSPPVAVLVLPLELQDLRVTYGWTTVGIA